MATVEELVRDVLGSLGSSAGAPLAAKWVDNRYKDLVSRVKFRHLRSVGELAVPAVVNEGTVVTTRGSTTVTGTSTTFETDLGGTGSKEYWWFRASSAWYKVASVTSETVLVLASEFAEDDVSGGGYVLVKRHLALDSNARWLGKAVHTRLRRTLDEISLTAMDVRYPGRRLTGVYPFAIAQVGTDSSNSLMVEVYPPPSASEIIHYVYWDLPTALSVGSTIPPQVDAHVLKEGVMVDAYRYEKALALRAGMIEKAAVWRNEERAQMTTWERTITRAVKADRGVDDLTFILQMTGGRSNRGDWQRTARDIVLDRWDYPA